MRVTLAPGHQATLTDRPLPLTPRFTGTELVVAPYDGPGERERFLAGTFGSQDVLWDTPDVLRFRRGDRGLAGAAFAVPEESEGGWDPAGAAAAVPGGLRADDERDFRLEPATLLCRAPGDAVLAGVRDREVLAGPLDARVGIAPGVALLVRGGAFAGWTLTDPARWLADDPAPPAPATRALLTECLDLTTAPLLYAVEDREPAALAQLRGAHETLRARSEDRRRAETLLALIATLMEDFGG
ncbi:hypothetical protein AB0O01_30220 [Streptomyces sp. NPDC093252]|uniref:hypothetical protein n=1 Tax=Streptomyces sp. NPDC093252 TaxID=3154980 RepID=UPI0034444913